MFGLNENEAAYQQKQAAEHAAAVKAYQDLHYSDCQQAAPRVAEERAERPYTLAGEAAARMKQHAEAHATQSAAYGFLIQHPEFDEFVRLVRSGSIQF